MSLPDAADGPGVAALEEFFAVGQHVSQPQLPTNGSGDVGAQLVFLDQPNDARATGAEDLGGLLG